jgi:phosphoesterase RecJ-like protein
MNNGTWQEVGQLLRDSRRILVCSHIRPDGDAIGSMLGLGLALQTAGKDIQMVLSDGIPVSFRHLPGSNQVVKKASGEFDLKVVLDCSDMLRTGTALKGYEPPDINIDHHVTNLNFARLNLVEPQEVATSAILAEYLPRWGFPYTPTVAAALLSGMISDTLGFRTSNMTPEALRLAADLMEVDTDLPELYNQALGRRSFDAACYWGQGLIKLERKGRMVWTSLTLADRETANYPGNDDADLINVLSSIEDADIALIFVEQRGGKIKVSWRAVPGTDVSAVALHFGGGGHAAASGAEIAGTMTEVQEKVLSQTLEFIKSTENGSSEPNSIS